MRERFVIKRPGKGGYWSDSKKSFVPITMCTLYHSNDEAIDVLLTRIVFISPSTEMAQVEPIYVREDSVYL
jgi:hypothetical protein